MILLPLPPVELLAINVGYYTVKGTALLVAHNHICREQEQQKKWCFRRTMLESLTYLEVSDVLALKQASRELEGILQIRKHADDHEYTVQTTMPQSDTVQTILRHLCVIQKRKNAVTREVVARLPSTMRWEQYSQPPEKTQLKVEESVKPEQTVVAKSASFLTEISSFSIQLQALDDDDDDDKKLLHLHDVDRLADEVLEVL